MITRPHRRILGAIAINRNGTLVATAPLKTKKIKIFSTNDGSIVLKVSRGSSSSFIKHLSFSFNSEMLSLTSDKPTVHVWRLGLEAEANPDAAANQGLQHEARSKWKRISGRVMDFLGNSSDQHMTW
mmetsp:Transcript_686/g.935  ORF Transcript_686/g.935 Transcript_686/m.935 type:complete len:127 (+) Transcript_686:767-1147(+)|eukprot:CAMPEP_0185581398 /NCGR_PEP_ID=MMETSP0434-20130131/18288_1 /TAXON_ID=626734 ORGANISM="Favella taraikaensis, Strain Fe Narragansett Bay" /NCGR_SAMPLE_ID=MMETSP0434 /ASSEMBLY_ACC=CAM_ASM_000379 /LENGTH=126 /DNA_ID=CAMNT_0028199923 /DNA_START=699 /DNA_END=1079 /DNA_ORIENTATION=-